MEKMTELEALLSAVAYNNELMRTHNKLIAMLYRESSNYYIVLDSHFNELSTDTQIFVLLHEAGHFLSNPYFTEDLNLKEENDADKFALSVLGPQAVLDAMNELYQYIAPLSIVGASEIGVRMEMLGFDISGMWMQTSVGKLTGDQFKLVFSNPEAITFR